MEDNELIYDEPEDIEFDDLSDFADPATIREMYDRSEFSKLIDELYS